MITTQPCQQVKIKFGGLNINVGGTKIFHAYTRSTEVDLPEVCDLKLNSDITICSGSSVQLTGVSGIQWGIENQPEGGTATVSAGGLVEHINKQGDYLVKAMKGNCVGYVKITRDPQSNISPKCNQPIVGDNIVTYSPEGGGCLLCLATGTNNDVNNMIDTDLNNFVEYTQGFDLASNTSIVGVQNTSRPYKPTSNKPIRVGFVMEATNQFLNVNLLKFFVIKTYKGGEEVESSLVNTNNAVSADLIAGSGNKVRYSFEATKDFDAVTLWTAGLLNINISKFKIYYAFQEPTDEDCYIGNMSSACTEVLSSENHGAEVAYNHTGFDGIANVGAYMTGIGNLIDDDINSSMIIGKVAGIGGKATVSVKINRVVGQGYQAGFIIRDITWVTNVDLLSKIGVKTYLDGIDTGDELGTPEVLSLDLIGSSDKAFVAVRPTMPFDEIQLDLTGLADVAISTDVYGAFIQIDTDGDGTPDCIDKNPCGDDLVLSGVHTYCKGDTSFVFIEGGKEGVSYKLWHEDKSYPFEDNQAKFVSDSVGQFNYVIKVNADTVIYNVPITIHPDTTQWKGGISTDWNEWDNWTEGIPSTCTDVIIPSYAKLTTTNGINYPILKDNNIYQCCGIHFEPGAEVVRIDLLQYEKAWVDMTMKPETYYMLSAPLKSTYSGDFFTLADNSLFSPLYGYDDINRAEPLVFFHIWNGNSWSDSYNLLKHPYALANGFVRNLSSNVSPAVEKYLFKFAKEDTLYHYYNNYGFFENETEIVSKENVGRFAIENSGDSTLWPIIAPVENDQAGNKFLVGNPFMCHLLVSEFLKENNHLLRTIKLFSNNEGSISDFESGSYQTIIVAENDTVTKIAPMQAFFVEVSSGEIAKASNMTFTPEMMVHGNYTDIQRADAPQTRTIAQEENSSKLRPTTLKAYTLNGEGIIESADKVAKLQVFTVAGTLLLEKQNVTAPVRIPLSEGVNIIKVQTENETKTFKLMK